MNIMVLFRFVHGKLTSDTIIHFSRVADSLVFVMVKVILRFLTMFSKSFFYSSCLSWLIHSSYFASVLLL